MTKIKMFLTLFIDRTSKKKFLSRTTFKSNDSIVYNNITCNLIYLDVSSDSHFLFNKKKQINTRCKKVDSFIKKFI